MIPTSRGKLEQIESSNPLKFNIGSADLPESMKRYCVLVFAAVFFSIELKADSGQLNAGASAGDCQPSTVNFDSGLYLGQKSRRRGAGGRAWSNLYYADTTLHPENAGKIDPETYGVQIGFDAVQSHGIYNTYFVNFQQNNVSTHKTGYGENVPSKSENYLFGFGKFYYLRASHFGFLGSAGYDEYTVYMPSQKINGDGLQANLFGEFGIDIFLGQWAFKPFYDLQYNFLYHGRIGDAASPERINDTNGHRFGQLFGMRTNWKPYENWDIQLRTVWLHDFLNEPQPFYNLHFSAVQGTMTPSVMVFRGSTGRDYAWAGIGSKFTLDFNFYIFADYDVMVNAYHTSHLVNLGLCLGW